MHHYKVNLNWTGDRKGEISSPDLESKINVATPPEFPKGIPGIWSPEHLFTAAVNSCFMTTFLAIAENSKLEYTEFSCESEGLLDTVDGKYLMTEILLRPKLKLVNIADKEKAERIFLKAEKACLISNSIKSTTRLAGEITH
ncbi:MAG: OsmC family protein [Bacteroidia bacterium]|nr:OsmC family protein [Bacteroidia bacterium]